MSKPPISICWFKRDLRVQDNAALTQAIAAGHPVLPLYIAEPDYWAEPDTSGRQWAFIAESLKALDEMLRGIGGHLVVKTGDATPILSAIASRYTIAGLYSHLETGNGWTYARDLKVKSWCVAQSVPWHEPRQFGVVRQLKSRDGWAKQWDALMAQPQAPTPTAISQPDMQGDAIPTARELGLPHDPCPGRQTGGRALALKYLDSFLHQRGQNYRKAMSSPNTGFEECSRLSPYLAYGCISMRETAQALWARQSALKQRAKDGAELGMWRGSMQSFSGRLHWHCHFTQKLESEPRQEFENLHPGYDGLRRNPSETHQGAAWMDAWSEGRMGLPFADACMRALNATGYLNFRMRAMLMAVSSYHLWLHWREPGLLYAQKFTDYEAGIHWPQVQMQSGTTGINTVRIYNPVKQGYDHDATGEFTRRWVPELDAVPDKYLQEPWNWDGADKLLDRTYPRRIVDHQVAAREAKVQVYGRRREDGFKAVSQEIFTRHGSRRGPMADRRKVAKAKEKAATTGR